MINPSPGMKWLKTQFLGKGSYGTVSLAVPSSVPPHPTDQFLLSHVPSAIAVKTSDFHQSHSLKTEYKILRRLAGCPDIIRCFGEDTSLENVEFKYNLLLEYAPGGSLLDLMKARRTCMPEFEVSWYAYMLLSSLAHIHRQGFVHCDIKPANILVFPCSKDGLTINHLKIADFGLTKKEGFPCAVRRFGRLFMGRGTPVYSSPEAVLMGLNESPSDIWALGCILVEMFTGIPAYWGFKGMDLMEHIATNEDLPKIPDFLSDNATDFLMRCLIRDPRERWSAMDLLNHPFIVDTSKESLLQQRAQLVSNNPLGRTLWWSGQSSFSTSPVPTRLPLLPHQLFSNNAALRAALCV